MRFLSLLLVLGTLLHVEAACNNNPPAGSAYSCEQQKTWGKCLEPWMKGFCEITCGTCTESQNQCNEAPPPPGLYSCAQQKEWGKCGETWMMGYCQQTCGTCNIVSSPPVMNTPTCTDIAPDAGVQFSCQQQKEYGKCDADWMKGYCQETCGECTCNDKTPPAGSDGIQYSCDQQRKWGKCGEPWMKGFCQTTCGTCPCNERPPPQQLFTCAQQKEFDQCDAPWMAGRCLQTCGKCMNSAPATQAPKPATQAPPQPATQAPPQPATQAPQPTQAPPQQTCNNSPPGGGYTCEQQKTWGKCNEAWMQGFCQITCGVCVPPNYKPPAGGGNVIPPIVPIVPGARLAVQDRNLVVSGRRVFLNGANMAWQNYGADFGAGTANTAYFPSQLKDALVSIRQAGGNSIRIWLHCSGDVSPLWGPDGKVTGLPGDLIPSMRAYLRAAKEQNILVVFVLWNFMITQKHSNFYYDDSIVESYIEKALIPMVTQLKDETALAAWEISNEPEGAANEYGWEPIKVPMARMQRAINWQAHAIHTVDTNILVTVGSWAADANTDVAGYQNRYTNQRLIAAGGGQKTLGYLDFYQLHYYRWMGRRNARSLIDNPASFYNLDKPLVLGEFSESGTDGMTIQQMYAHAYDSGYAGAWAWQANGGGQDSDSFATILKGIASLSSFRPQNLEVDLNGQLPASFLVDGKPSIVDRIPDMSGTGPDLGATVEGPKQNRDPVPISTSSSLNIGVVAGIAVGAAVAFIIVILALVMYRRKQRTRVESTSSHMSVV